MEIVIKINKDWDWIVEWIKDYEEIPQNADQEIYRAIMDGIPLPKGCGRLRIMSEDFIKTHFVNFDGFSQKFIGEVDLSNATIAVIEADKEQEE